VAAGDRHVDTTGHGDRGLSDTAQCLPLRLLRSGPLGPRTLFAVLRSVALATDGRSLMTDPSPHEAEDLAAHVALARLTVGQETLAGREHGHPQPTEDPGDLALKDTP
jgi:hypothetical protein